MALKNVIRPAVFFGKVVTSEIPQAVKVAIDKYVMDTRLTMYFKEKKEVYAYDNTREKTCSDGDYVIVRECPESEDRKITHSVEKLVYKFGYFIDPLSGRKCAGTEFIDDIQRTTELFGYTRPFQNNDSNK